MYSYHGRGGKERAAQRAGQPGYPSRMALVSFSWFLFSIWVKISLYTYIMVRGGFTMKLKKLYFLQVSLLLFTRPFKALPLALVLLYL